MSEKEILWMIILGVGGIIVGYIVVMICAWIERRNMIRRYERTLKEFWERVENREDKEN
jgi:hypothetical protein